MWLRLPCIIFAFGICHLANSQNSKIDSLEQIISLGKKDIEEAKAYNAIANKLLRNDFNGAKAHLNVAVSLGKNLQSSRVLSNSYSQLVIIFHNTGNIDSAAYFITTLKNLATEDNDGDKDLVWSNYYSRQDCFIKNRSGCGSRK